MSDELSKLTSEQQVAVRRVIEKAIGWPGRHAHDLTDGSEVYAYLSEGGQPSVKSIIWGVNSSRDGPTIAQGTVPK